MMFPNKSEQKKFLTYLLIAGGVFLLDFWPLFKPVKNIFSYFLQPLKRETYHLGRLDIEQVFYSRKLKSMEEENKKLKEELTAKEGEATRCQQVYAENQRLASLLTFLPKRQNLVSSAWVISHHGDYLVIDRGEDDGVAIGQWVIEDQYLVGQVSEVYRHEARVIKLGSASFEIPVVIFSGELTACLDHLDSCQKGRGIMVGGTVKEILKEEEVAIGNLVALSGDDFGLLVGRISQVKESQDKLFKQAQVEQLVNFNQLTEVFLIKQ